MKRYIRIVSGLTALSACLAHGQGSFIYDQQSSTTDNYTANSLAPITQVQPMGQSFTPTLPSVGFIRLYLDNGIPFDTGPATIALNLRANSITGQILGSSQVTLTPGFVGDIDFLFNAPVTVTPGTTYFFQPVVEVGGNWSIGSLGDFYPGGTAYSQGNPTPIADLFFREGVLVPEPSTATLAIVAAAALLLRRKRKE